MSTNLPALVWDEGTLDFQRKLGNFVQYFQVNLPNNAYGVPLQLVNPVALAGSLLHAETTDDVPDDIVESAIINIDFDDGLPVVDGVPVWERFDGESLEYYRLFKEYRDAPYVAGSRAIAKLAGTFNIVGKNLNALAKVYHWQLRCRAYDLYKKMEFQRKRELEVEKLEGSHSKAAEKMLEQGLEYLEGHPEQLNPKIAVQMVQLAVKVGRLAVGLNPDKPGASETIPGTSININQTAGNAGEMSTTVQVNEANSQPGTQDLSNLQSILHILDKSGALDKIKVVDAEYTVVDDVEAS